MYKKLIFFAFFVFVLGLVLTNRANAADPSLVGWWKFDDGSGNIAKDSSGNGNDGTLNGGAQWVEGQLGGAIEFNGSNSYVSAPHIPLNSRSFTIAMWVNPVLYTDQQVIFGQHQTGSQNLSIHFRLYGPNSGRVRMGFYSNDLDTSGNTIQENNWYHLTFWYDFENQNRRIYVNGAQEAEGSAGPFLGTSGETRIGQWNNNQWFRGIIDDVRIYSRALTDSEIIQAMIGIPPGVASEPSPADEATDIPRDVTLSWKPGEFAPAVNGHTIYLSESFNDVNDGIGGTTVSATSYTPAQRLDFETIYYWRVDEVNAPPD
ncbi:MAG: LamG domain-containing protein, partial [Phycisphaerales bacterium]